jgi:hypothetical protein
MFRYKVLPCGDSTSNCFCVDCGNNRLGGKVHQPKFVHSVFRMFLQCDDGVLMPIDFLPSKLDRHLAELRVSHMCVTQCSSIVSMGMLEVQVCTHIIVD